MRLRYAAVLTMGLLAQPLIAEEPAKPAASLPPADAAAKPADAVARPADGTAKPADTMSQDDKLSYSFGQRIGRNLKREEVKINLDLLATGIKEAFTDNAKLLISAEEVDKIINDYQKEKFAKQIEQRKQQGEKNLKEGEAFLAENAKKEGVKTLESGLQYKVLTPGTGKSPKDTDTVTVNYKGTTVDGYDATKGAFIDGKEFDSSYKRGQPATFPVKGVISGWTEALQLMKEGDKWLLFIPSKSAYGEKGNGPTIAPNSTLIFEVELVKVNDKPAESADKPAADAAKPADGAKPAADAAKPAAEAAKPKEEAPKPAGESVPK